MKNPTKTISIIEKTALVNLRFAKTTGRKKLQPSDLGLTESQLPPDQIATLGAKSTINPEKLKVFDTLKRRADRLCQINGIKLSAQTYAIPENKIVTFCKNMDTIILDYEKEVIKFINHYDQMVTDWIDIISIENPSWGDKIKNSASTSESLKGKFFADYEIYQLHTGAKTVAQEITLNKQSQRISSGMTNTVYDELNVVFELFKQDQMKGVKAKIVMTALNKVQDRVDSLTFIDSSFFEVSKLLKKAISFIPVSGLLTTLDMMNISGVLHVISTPDLLTAVLKQQKTITEISNNDTSTAVINADKAIITTVETSIDDDCDFSFGNNVSSPEPEIKSKPEPKPEPTDNSSNFGFF